jgi:hypothetical protein
MTSGPRIPWPMLAFLWQMWDFFRHQWIVCAAFFRQIECVSALGTLSTPVTDCVDYTSYLILFALSQSQMLRFFRRTNTTRKYFYQTVKAYCPTAKDMRWLREIVGLKAEVWDKEGSSGKEGTLTEAQSL